MSTDDQDIERLLVDLQARRASLFEQRRAEHRALLAPVEDETRHYARAARALRRKREAVERSIARLRRAQDLPWEQRIDRMVPLAAATLSVTIGLCFLPLWPQLWLPDALRWAMGTFISGALFLLLLQDERP